MVKWLCQSLHHFLFLLY